MNLSSFDNNSIKYFSHQKIGFENQMTSRRDQRLNHFFFHYLSKVIDRFHCQANKKQIGNRPVEEAKKMKCFKRLIFKQFIQVSGLCGPKFLSYLPKRFTHLCRALYGDDILVYRFGAPIWPPEINKNIWSSLFL